MKSSHDTGHAALLIGYAILMIVVVVAVDILFFRHRALERLVTNVAIVLVFLAAYLLLLRRG